MENNEKITVEIIPILKIKIGSTDIFLEELGAGKGKITVSDTYGHNYSSYWGSMRETLKNFICSINSSYFASNLLGAADNYEMDVKKTFASIRKYIAEELGLPWYKHMEFQKEMRETLNCFKRECEDTNSQDYFVGNFFSSFVDRLNYYLIEDRYDRESIEKDFKGICEQWNFIETRPGREYVWLEKLHAKLKKELSKI